MSKMKNAHDPLNISNDISQRGSAIVIALFALALISVFVAFALSRTASEAAAVGNETAEARTLYAAQGSLEMMTRNFNKVFEVKLNPSDNDLDKVRNGIVPGLEPQFEFNQELDRTSKSTPVVLSDGAYTGLYAIRDNWRLRSTATDQGGTEIMLTRNILNNRVPIFQFGIFYDDDLELFRPPRFSFGGRVHSNRHFFLSPGSEGVYFDSRVTAAGHIITQTWRNGYTDDRTNNQTFIKNASGAFKQLRPDRGSVLNGTPNVFAADPDLPSSRLNTDWANQSKIFDGNLQSQVKLLKLPLSVGSNIDLIEMVKRGKRIADVSGGDLAWNGTAVAPVSVLTIPANTANVDNDVVRSERFANKTGLRVSLSDTKAKLPGCALGTGTAPVTTACGVRLDGHIGGQIAGAMPTPLPIPTLEQSRGYQPKTMTDGYQATRVNGERLHTGGGREVWIKVETVQTNSSTGAIETSDITEEILSLGVTEEFRDRADNRIYDYSGSRAGDNNGTFSSPSANLTATTPQGPLTYPDSRSVIKLQRFEIRGAAIPDSSNFLFSHGSGSSATNVVRRFSGVSSADALIFCELGVCAAKNNPSNSSSENYGHLKRAEINNVNDEAIVPFPIEMFDTREGEYYDDADRYDDDKVTRNGVMSLVDIDVANLRRFLRGDFNGRFPINTPFAIKKGSGLVASWNALISSDIPQKEGWVLYVSDRRGDADFDGEYDMEDIYSDSPGNLGGTINLGEDVNRNSILDAKYIEPNSDSCVGFATDCEAAKYADEYLPALAAVTDHKYYRRAVRLINGTTIPGIYDSSTPANTRGFTVASENGIYVKGNYNATHVTNIPAEVNTPFEDYRPLNSVVHIPASIVADGVTVLSNNWLDAESFMSAYNKDGSYRQASDTTVRFAMISGDTIASKQDTPHQGGISPRLNGGVHNFKRFLEKWTDIKLNYSGSLINLYNSRNNNGSFKCCNTVYNPPRRNWVFDGTFLDPSRLPPGTPFFQYVQTTGFERATS